MKFCFFCCPMGGVVQKITARDDVVISVPAGLELHVVEKSVYKSFSSDKKYDAINEVLVDKTVVPYVADKTVVEANGIDRVVISGLPENTLVQFDALGIENAISGQTEFGIDMPGSYNITLSHCAYRDKIVTIVAE